MLDKELWVTNDNVQLYKNTNNENASEVLDRD